MNKANKFIVGTAMAGLSLAALPAMAGHVAGVGFNGETFSFDGSKFSDDGGLIDDLNFIDFSYTAELDQDDAGNFLETGGAFFGTFRESLGGQPIPGTGLFTEFSMYALFTVGGTQVTNGAGDGIDATFTSFTVDFYIDEDQDTTFYQFTQGADGGDESINFGNTLNTGDDTLILSGTLNIGGAHIFGGLGNGDFDVLFDVTSFDNEVWGGEAFELVDGAVATIGDFNGVNTKIEGIIGADIAATDALLVGSGNTAFQVPEPATLMLFGIGLLGIGRVSRRRTNNNN